FNITQYQLAPSIFSDALDAGLNAIPLGNAPLSSAQIMSLIDPVPSPLPTPASSPASAAPATPTPTSPPTTGTPAATPPPAATVEDDDYTWEVDAAALQDALK